MAPENNIAEQEKKSWLVEIADVNVFLCSLTTTPKKS
jgi:hypothetical protein